jgi:hypothetical protein
MEKVKNQGKPKKVYQKPGWQKQEIYERFVMSCSHKTGQNTGCTNNPGS